QPSTASITSAIQVLCQALHEGHHTILYDIYCLMLWMMSGCMRVAGCLTGGVNRLSGLEFRRRCPALDRLAANGSVGEVAFHHESFLRSFNPMRDRRPLHDFRCCQDR